MRSLMRSLKRLMTRHAVPKNLPSAPIVALPVALPVALLVLALVAASGAISLVGAATRKPAGDVPNDVPEAASVARPATRPAARPAATPAALPQVAQIPAGDTDKTLAALHDELERSRTRLALPGQEKPYYIEYRLLDLDERTVSAQFGAVIGSTTTRNRFMSVDVRVGDYKLDSSNFISDQGFRGFLGLYRHRRHRPRL